MAIIMMCQPNTPGAVLCESWSKPDSPIYTVETHTGLVLSTGENNHYDDSDFYAIVWNVVEGKPERIEYATTRAWTYPNHASVDATPEVVAAHRAFQKAEADAAMARRQRCEAMTPTKGKRVRFVRATTVKAKRDRQDIGRIKIAAGTQAEVFWYGEEKPFGAFPRGGYKEHGRDMRRMVDQMLPPIDGVRNGHRVGVKLPDGASVFTAATNVMVVLADGERSEGTESGTEAAA